jgi:hypothetical protein
MINNPVQIISIAEAAHQVLAGPTSGAAALPIFRQLAAADLSDTATSGNVLRGNGSIFTSAALAASDLSDGTTGSGAVVLAASPTFTTLATSPEFNASSVSGYELLGQPAVVSDGTSMYIRPPLAAGNVIIQNQPQTSYLTLYASGGVCLTAGGDPGTNNLNINGVYKVGNTSGVVGSVGPYTGDQITALTVKGGIVTTYTGTSDERLKTDIVPFSRGLDAIGSIAPVTYSWNEAGQKISGFAPGMKQTGFSAQNVQKTIPEAVGLEGEYLTLDTRPILCALVNAIKELSAKVNELSAQITELKAAR